MHLSNLIRIKHRSCGELNLAVRFGARKDPRLSRYYSQSYLLFIKYSLYSFVASIFFLSPSSNSLLLALNRPTLHVLIFFR